MRRNGARNNVNKSNHKKGIFSKKKKRNEKENENEWRGGRKQTDKDRDYSKKCDLWSEVIEWTLWSPAGADSRRLVGLFLS